MRKSLKDISWLVSEEVYRKDSSLSYSTIAKYEREGFNKLSSLFDKVESPSLTFGSCVDSIITGGEEEFNERFIVAEYPQTPDSIITIVKELHRLNKDKYNDINDIDNDSIINVAIQYNYQPNWKPETRAKVIKEKGAEYYKLLYISENKTIIDSFTYTKVINAVDALKHSEATKYYFESDNLFDDNVERLYQLKFKATFDGVPYRCMADELIVLHKDKVVIPVDLKTSFKPEWDFYKSFIEWRYCDQSRLYWNIIRSNMDKDDYFKDFKLADYRFIVVNKETLTPLVWVFNNTTNKNTLITKEGIELRHPFVIGKELYSYLQHTPRVPNGISLTSPNIIDDYIL